MIDNPFDDFPFDEDELIEKLEEARVIFDNNHSYGTVSLDDTAIIRDKSNNIELSGVEKIVFDGEEFDVKDIIKSFKLINILLKKEFPEEFI